MSEETTKTDAPKATKSSPEGKKETKVEAKAAGEKPAKESKAEAKAAAPKKKKKPKRRLVVEGKAYIQASFNNTIVTIADLDGNVLTWNSAGASGFKGPKKATPYAAQISAEKAAEKAKVYGLERVHVVVKGAGNGREQAIRGLHTGGLNIESIVDVTTVPHNGCRPKKTRRI